MAELVQHRRHLVEREQRRQAVGRLRKVVDHRDQRPRLDAVLDSLLAELGHPCSAAFRGAGEEVHIQNGQKTPVGIEHLVGFHVGMIDRNLRIFAQRDPVQTVRQLEHAPPYVLQLEIGLRQLFAQFVALVLELLGVVAEVPRHQLGVEALSAGVAGHGFHIAARSLDSPVEQFRQKGVDRRGALGHTLFQHVVGICLVSKQTGKLQTLVGNFLDNGGVVELAAHAAGVISPPELLFQGAIRRISHKRDHAGNLQRDDPSVEPALLGLGRHALADEVGQLPDDGRIGHMKRKGIRGRQRVLVELKAQLREAGGQFAVYLLVSVGKGRAAAANPL